MLGALFLAIACPHSFMGMLHSQSQCRIVEWPRSEGSDLRIRATGVGKDLWGFPAQPPTMTIGAMRSFQSLLFSLPLPTAVGRMRHRTIHLFRKGLQLHDNPALLAALQSSEVVYPVYILDRAFMTSSMHIGALRWHFLLQSLEDLRSSLCQLGSCLLVIQGEYDAVVRDHVQKWNITQVTLDAEMEPFYKEMEANIRALGEELGFEVLSLMGHSLYNTQRYVAALQTSKASPKGLFYV